MKSAKKYESESDEEGGNENKETDEKKFKSDKELLNDLANSLEKEIVVFNDEKVVLTRGDGYTEVDGVKMTSFSLDEELETGSFDKSGNFCPKLNGNEEEEEYSTDEQEILSDELINEIRSDIANLISLLPPQTDATTAISACKNDSERLIKITDLATKLLYNGKSNIYSMTIDELKADLEKMGPKKKSEEEK